MITVHCHLKTVTLLYKYIGESYIGCRFYGNFRNYAVGSVLLEELL